MATSPDAVISTANKLHQAVKVVLVIAAGLAMFLLPMLVPNAPGPTAGLSIAQPVKAYGGVLSHDLNVVNSRGPYHLRICEHWGWSSPVSRSTCAPSGDKSRTGTLEPGESSRSVKGWRDTDGIYVPRGYQLKEDVPGRNPTLLRSYDHGQWKKVSPSLGRHTKRYYLRRL